MWQLEIRIRNEEVRRVEVKVDLSERAERCALRWLGHVQRKNSERIAKRVYESRLEGKKGRGRPNSVWMNGVRKALNARGLTLEQAKMNVYDRVEWREFWNKM